MHAFPVPGLTVFLLFYLSYHYAMLFSPFPLQEFNIDDDNDAMREKGQERQEKAIFYYYALLHITQSCHALSFIAVKCRPYICFHTRQTTSPP